MWDTVGALGVPDFGIPGVRWLNRRWAFHDVTLSSRVRTACHALSLDEARSAFVPALWHAKPGADQEVAQVWFAGVHCDVGGGYAERGLADLTLQWMTEQTRRCGLAFDELPVPAPDAALDEVHESRTGLYRLVPPAPRRPGRTDPEHEFVADSAVRRVRDLPGYGSAPLREHLADGGRRSDS